MFLPGAANGLLLVSSLADKGANVEFNLTTCAGLVKPNNKVILLTQPGFGYIINASLVRKADSDDGLLSLMASSTRTLSSAPLMTWHKRFGHIAPSTILNLVAKGSVKGITLLDKRILDCDLCFQTRSTRLPLKATLTKMPRSLHRVFMDLGFVDHNDHDGRRIYLAIIDQHLAARWTFVLASKKANVVLKVFHDWCISVERLTGNKLVHICSDNGGEFSSKNFKDYFVAHGIIHKTTAPYTPEQNAQVERLCCICSYNDYMDKYNRSA